ncbi:MAG: DUF748 domain-containing protein [Aquabacterium sp.]
MSAESPPRSQTLWTRWRKPVLGVAAGALAWTAVVGAWLPDWLRPRIETAATEALGTPVKLAGLAVHPWTARVRVEGLSVGPASAPLLTLQQAQVQLSVESLWRLAPVIRQLTLTRPELRIERLSAERFNFSPLLDKLAARPNEPASEPLQFAVFNILLQEGRIRYTDRVLGQTHAVEQLRVGVPFVSNLPSRIDVEVLPELSATVDGSPLRLTGRTLPFQEGMRSSIDVGLDRVDVPLLAQALAPWVPEAWRPAARTGQLAVALKIGFEARKPPQVPHLSIQGRAQLDKLDLGWADAPTIGAASLGWDSLKVEGIDAAPLERRVALGTVALQGLSWQSDLRLTPGKASATAPVAAPLAAPVAASSPAAAGAKTHRQEAPEDTPWAWHIGQLNLQTERIDVQPHTGPARPAAQNAGPRWPALAMVKLLAKGLDSRAKAAPASWQLELRDEHQATLLGQGTVQPAQQALTGRLNLSHLALPAWLAPLSSALQVPVALKQGELALEAELSARLQAASATEPAQARLVSGRVQLQGMDAQATARGLKDRIRLAALTLEGVHARADLGAQAGLREAGAASLLLSGLDADVTRGPHGEWMGISPAATSPGPPAGPPDASAAATGSPAALALQSLRCEDCRIRLVDQGVTPAAHFDVSRATLALTDLSNDLARPIQVALDTQAQGPGRLNVKGSVRPAPLSVDARVQVAGLDLRAIQPYIDPWVNFTLAGAKARADGQLVLKDQGPAGLSARYRGRAGLSDLRVQDRVNDADFLRWRQLGLDGLNVNWSGNRLDADLGRIALQDFYGRLIINANGELNLAGILRHQAGAQARSLTTPEPASKAASSASGEAVASASLPASTPASAASVPAASAPSAPSADPAKRPSLRWQRIELAKGRIDFTDNFIKPNYSARLTQVEGEVSAVSSERPEPATLRIAGAVDDAAPLRITGQIHPLGPRLYTDIEGSAKGIELTRLTPYAARYAGYAIEKGSLSVTVHYKVDGGKLEASNQIFLDQLTFGEKTDSPDAIQLPVLLAVALLKNSRGEIDVNLPISGSLDDPQFSVGGIIWRVIVNLITKAVLAPFSLLTGGSSEELGVIPFDPGSARLSDAARERLDKLADKLQDRPALKLEATGRADPQVDVEGLRRVHLQRLMRAAKARATGVPASDVQITDEERATWIKAAYKEADIRKPRNVVGLPKGLSTEEMASLLEASAAVNDEALRSLANRRGDAVKAYLATKMPPERVLLTASKLGREGLPEDKEPSSRVQFSVK